MIRPLGSGIGFSGSGFFRLAAAHRGKLLVLASSLFLLLPLADPPATAMGSRPRAVAPTAERAQTPEALLAQALLDIRANRLDQAMARVDALIAAWPNFRLAHLVKGDLLMARARPIHRLGAVPDLPESATRDFQEEARVRLTRYLEAVPREALPAPVLKLSPEQRHVLVVDTERSRLYVFRNDGGLPRYVTDYYVTVGKRGVEKTREGDQRTPLGVYTVIDDLPTASLGDFYGSAAFPIDYPNEWDRRLGKNGSGIWLHGVPSATYSRPPRASNGCVVLANEDISALRQYLDIGQTPVIITRGLAWLPGKTWQQAGREIEEALERWRRDWESRDAERLLAHYARAFSDGKRDYAAFSAHKRAVLARKRWIAVTLRNVSAFRYPGRDDLVVVSFDQDYRSDNYAQSLRKRQYWVKQDGQWQIAYEGVVNQAFIAPRLAMR